MRHFKPFIFVIVMVIIIASAAAAPAEGTLVSLWRSGCDLLFHTHNVTVTGTAAFTLDGELFKTARLDYVQDGVKSFYGLKLLTPKDDGTDRETGWTIIAGEGEVITVMEDFYPGTYRQGSATAQNTLLRRSVQLDALTELGGYLADQLEPMLPEGAVAAEDNGVKTVHIALSGDQIPDLAVSALNIAARYLSDRWFSYTHDREYNTNEAIFDSYITVTQALTDGTVKWTLTDADIDAALDAHGRFTAVSGTVKVSSTFWDGSVREVAVRFDLAMTDYGASRVKPFDPADYGMASQASIYGEEPEDSQIDMDGAAWDDMKARADDLLLNEGYAVDAGADWGGWLAGDSIIIHIDDPEEMFMLSFTEDGSLTSLQHLTGDWLSAEEADEIGVDREVLASADAYMRAFIAKTDPAVLDRIGVLEPQTAILTEGSRYLKVHDTKDNAHFVLRVEPSLRVEDYFSAYPGTHDAAGAE